MSLPVYSSHTGPLSLFQSAVHEVLSQQPAQQNSTHAGIGVTAQAPEMQAVSAVAKHFDKTGNFDVAPAAATAGAAAPAAPLSVRSQCAQLAAQIALYSVTDPAKAEILRQEFQAGTCDPLWAQCLAVYDQYRLSQKAQPYINYQSIDDFVIEMCFPDNATIAVIGED